MTWKEIDPIAMALYNADHPEEPVRGLHEWRYIYNPIKAKYRKLAKEHEAENRSTA